MDASSVLQFLSRMKFSFLAALIALILCTSCGSVRELELTGVKGFTVNEISTAGINGDMLLSIKNPNNMAVTVFPSTFSVTYSGVPLGMAKLAKKVRIKKNSEETYSFNIKSDFSKVNIADIMKILQGASFRSEVGVKGDLKAGKLFYRRKIPVDVKEKISLK